MTRRAPLSPQALALLALSLASFGAALVGGLLSSLYYLPAVYPKLRAVGVEMQQAHSVHTTFAFGWIYLAAVAFVHEAMSRNAPFSRAERARAAGSIALFSVAGAGIMLSLAAKVYTGREYVEYHPAFAALILGGWGLFTWTFLARVWGGFWRSPVYVYMWTVGCLLFVLTYTEQHLWRLLPFGQYPIADLQVQWKSLGAMIGSFNLFVYGIAMYLAERVTGNTRYAQSPAAFALFGVGLLNSFTNYGHHTYHLPQSGLVKWIAFVVSMLEIILLARALFDVTRPVPAPSDAGEANAQVFLRSARWWTLGNLALAILISVPPLNTLIHGTLVVVAHSMGATIGVDTMILLGATAWLLPECRPCKVVAVGLNVSLAALVLALGVHGLAKGYARYLGATVPAWSNGLYVAFVLAGVLTAACLATVALRMALPLATAVTRARAEAQASRATRPA